MKTSLSTLVPSSDHFLQFIGGAVLMGLMTVTVAQAQSDNFDSGTDAAWTHYAPGGLGQTFNFPTNPISAGNLGYQITSPPGTGPNPGRVGSYLMGGPSIPDFVVTTDLLNWNNAQSQNMGVMARVQSPLPGTTFPLGYALVYADRFSAGGGGTDQLRIYKVVSGGLGFMNTTTGGSQTNGNLGQFGVVSGGDAAPNPSKDYQLVFMGVNNLFMGQIIDKSTGLALTFNDGFGGLTNTLWASDPGAAAGYGALYTTGNAGYFGFVGGGVAGSTDPTFDNFEVLAVPEPSIIGLVTFGSVAIIWVSRRQYGCCRLTPSATQKSS